MVGQLQVLRRVPSWAAWAVAGGPPAAAHPAKDSFSQAWAAVEAAAAEVAPCWQRCPALGVGVAAAGAPCQLDWWALRAWAGARGAPCCPRCPASWAAAAAAGATQPLLDHSEALWCHLGAALLAR